MGHHGMRPAAEVNKETERALKITTWLTGIYFIIELALGIYSGSIAVISDALHTFSAVGGVLLALIASRIALRPADKYKTFGRFRAEIIGALLNGFFLLVMAAVVMYMGYLRLLTPIELPTTPMFVAAIGGLITEAISLKLLYGGQKTSLNIKGAYWHVIQTFVGSLIIIIAAVVITLTGFLPIDPLLGMAFGVILFYASWRIIKGSLDILFESVPSEIDLDKVKESLYSVKGVQDIHHIHAWTLTSGKNIFSSHMRVENLSASERVLKEVHAVLKETYHFYFSTVQIETACTDEGDALDIDIEAGKRDERIDVETKHNHHEAE